MGVEIKCKHVIFPAEPTWEGKCPLSELDQVGVISHIPVLYFYDRPNHEDWVDPSKNKVIETLKESMSRALVSFYPLAGRLRWVNGRRMELECNANNSGGGAELIEAESSYKITDFGDSVDSSKLVYRDLLTPLDYVNTPIEQLPLLSVQVTRFACGGICVGIQISHVIADGVSAFHFVKEWARVARGEPIMVAPFLDRFEPTQIPTTADATQAHNSFYVSRNDERKETSAVTVSPTFVILTADRIESLKKTANQQAGMLSRPYSRVEVITAHVWRCMTRARQSEIDQVMPLTIICDIRSRLDPPLPRSYFGNAAVAGVASANAGDLTSNPLSYACMKVRDAISEITYERVQGFIALIRGVENLSNIQCIQDRGRFAGNLPESSNLPVMCVNSWLNTLAQGLDFGWGDEVYAGSPFGDGLQGLLSILPHNRSDGSVKLALRFKNEDMSSKFFDFMSSKE